MAALCLALLASLVLAISALAATSPVKIDGAIALKQLKTAACKSGTGKVKGVKETDISCSDTGVLNRKGVSYAWLWRLRGPKGGSVSEVGNLGINRGDGFLYLHMTGKVKTVGKSTTKHGVARVTGTVSFLKGTGPYKKRTATGTYTFDVVRNATTYQVLKLTLHVTVR
jgi:hypothetical protein